MKTRMAAGAAALVMSAVLSAPPAMAQPTRWTMPDLRGMNLAAAQEAYTAATDGEGPELEYSNESGPTEVLNLTNWTVCWQSPRAGSTFTAKSWTGVGVNRPNKC
ncbi:hypothetical protein [Mycolicibacterium monacense]|uniref:PASTA domain-containing protein n=1 Tax=Mycolicibacterium monacense TaxID=85693 RepID=A0AAD1IZB9_MYCMB|nr:hypothetical protein [Mycolicibacterium monacense]MDA4101846.1 hypothetical protein [Mycolicibacterium monacense DSM 44395]OBB75580.1 hypothetical protein A6B34_13390 [Mycolicibacterium monacense]OBF54948.1 hypothetical protein A5778_09505 [Mycolicibacterium monacense]ORB12229.1 hypothetical protein BST34_27435 [Mycolicibacterium monacense DSM 44395]QHP84786.1 hypothetical protein EWR22_05105 [Mycolicibacterium monacense DSM 44395]